VFSSETIVRELSVSNFRIVAAALIAAIPLPIITIRIHFIPFVSI